jgi:putative phage-type endonuclease
MLTPEQISARQQGIGASETVILFPEIPNSYSTPYQLWMLKTGRVERDQEMNDFQWWGHKLEPAIAERYEYETGETLEHRPDTVIHPRLPFMLCHPDRYVFGKRKLVEIKTAQYSPEQWGEAGTDHIPPAYLIQCQHQMACTGYEQVDLIVFFVNFRQSRIYTIKRDDEFIATLESTIIHFWNNHVLADVAPDLTSLTDCKLKFKNRSADFVEADNNTLQLIASLREIRARLKIAEKQDSDCLKQLLSFIGEKSGIKQDDKILVTWKADKNGKRSFRLSEI